MYIRYYVPSASLPPGHFCLAILDVSVAGHAMLHVLSISKGHPPATHEMI